jgi:DNA-binding CsgD family transcriptional regulator
LMAHGIVMWSVEVRVKRNHLNLASRIHVSAEMSDWPACRVRELRSVVEVAGVLTGSGQVDAGLLRFVAGDAEPKKCSGGFNWWSQRG